MEKYIMEKQRTTKQRRYYTRLKEIYMFVGEVYMFENSAVKLNEIIIKENLISGERKIEYVFQYVGTLTTFKIAEEELVKKTFSDIPVIFSAKDIYDSVNYMATSILKSDKLPRKVIFNDKKKATTLLYGDEATVVKACKGDKYDKEKGFLMAFFQKQTRLSKTQAKKYLKKITEQE